jgi:uncharacterized protein (DUF2252 family)
MGGTPPGAVRDDGAMTSTPTAAAYDPNAPRVVPHPTPSERQARGKAARAQAPREAHADLCLPAERPDPVALLEGQATTRVPELIPIRYGRMLVSPFTFYRGGALIMAGDLAGTPDSGLTVQACGDAHLSNFGVFGTPERHLIFDVNDFDETLPGPWEWDVKRLAASLEIAGRDRGFAGKERKEVVLAAVEQYRQAMHSFAAMGNLDLWYLRFDVDAFLERFRRNLDKAALKRVEKNIAKARGRDRYKTVAKLTHEVDGELRFLSDPPLIVPIDELFEQAADREMLKASFSELLRAYRATLQPDRRALLEQYEFMDLARKVVGVGSVGTRAWIVVLRGRDAGDPLVLQVKEAQRSVLEGFAAPSVYENQGQRVVEGQRLTQASSDLMLGWQRATGVDGVERDFYVRQLKDWKGSAELETMLPAAMVEYARMCGWTLARGHARSGDRIAIAAYLGKSETFARAIAEYARAYADRNEADYALLREAADTGRIEVEAGV